MFLCNLAYMRNCSAVKESNSQPIEPKFDTLSRCAIYKSTTTYPQIHRFLRAPPGETLAPSRYFRSTFLSYSQSNATREDSYGRAEGLLLFFILLYIVYSIRFQLDNLVPESHYQKCLLFNL